MTTSHLTLHAVWAHPTAPIPIRPARNCPAPDTPSFRKNYIFLSIRSTYCTLYDHSRTLNRRHRSHRRMGHCAGKDVSTHRPRHTPVYLVCRQRAGLITGLRHVGAQGYRNGSEDRNSVSRVCPEEMPAIDEPWHVASPVGHRTSETTSTAASADNQRAAAAVTQRAPHRFTSGSRLRLRRRRARRSRALRDA